MAINGYAQLLLQQKGKEPKKAHKEVMREAPRKAKRQQKQEKAEGKSKGKGKKGPEGGCCDCGGDLFKVNCPKSKRKRRKAELLLPQNMVERSISSWWIQVRWRKGKRKDRRKRQRICGTIDRIFSTSVMAIPWSCDT